MQVDHYEFWEGWIIPVSAKIQPIFSIVMVQERTAQRCGSEAMERSPLHFFTHSKVGFGFEEEI
ncbi:hypothetical protein E2562_033421 [Oryza meyeriana var. granulata]|uniref:Uncharacterized protein n=1 Tax=Oryza meyeriana var. granulata TaxID=110450 RepID=A0A6G1CW41_9ORYZ|nr:hypothetical protein E2562_033421 [Oryza meyeriana var. granulata]